MTKSSTSVQFVMATSKTASIHDGDLNLGDLQLERILSEDLVKKRVTALANVVWSRDPAVITLQGSRWHWDFEDIQNLLSKDTRVTRVTQNDIYGLYKIQNNGCSLSLIHPANEKHIEKNQWSPAHVIHETPHLYRTQILPHIYSEQPSLQWVYNLFDHNKETDRIMYEYKDEDEGFILAKDSKMFEESGNDFHYLAIIQKKGIMSQDHLSMLKNIKRICLEAVEYEHKLDPEDCWLYIKYQPTFYHLHVHLTPSHSKPPVRAHLLEDVISNLEEDGLHYKKATLTFKLKENDSLYGKLQEKGYFDVTSRSQSRKRSIELDSGYTDIQIKLLNMAQEEEKMFVAEENYRRNHKRARRSVQFRD